MSYLTTKQKHSICFTVLKLFTRCTLRHLSLQSHLKSADWECLSDTCITSSSSDSTTTLSTNSLSRSVIYSVCLINISALTDEEMVVNSIVFMVAGYETTATTLSWLFYDLAIHSDIQDKLVQEIDSDLGKVYHTLVLVVECSCKRFVLYRIKQAKWPSKYTACYTFDSKRAVL